jgi:hypothetical protein
MEAASEATHEVDSISEWLSTLVSPVRNDMAGKLVWKLPKDPLCNSELQELESSMPHLQILGTPAHR